MRVLLITGAMLALVGGAFAALGSGPAGDGDGDYRVAAIFDTARGLVPGQQVKVAGAVVGRVERVKVIPGPKARVELSVQRRFAPFGTDATCTILPEGLISENYVECVPGRRDAPLRPAGDDLPTVPLAQTTVPTSLQDLLNAFSLPVDDRIRAIINELGIATAGRGEDLNALLRRANPALAQTQRVLGILEAQRTEIRDAVTHTDRVLHAVGDREDDLRGFLRHATDVAETTAAHRDQLGAAVRALPPALAAVRPGLRALRRTARRATPLLRDLRRVAPELQTLNRRSGPFVRDGTPAVRSLASTARTGMTTVRAARPVVRTLADTAAAMARTAPDLDVLLRSTRDTGGFEALLRAFYSTAVSMSAYDDISHIVGLAVSVFPQCIVAPTTRACNHNYGAPGNGTIPVNSPDCGPRGGATWDPPTTCAANPVAVRRGTKRHAKAPSRPRPSSGNGGAGGFTPLRPATRPPVTLPRIPALPGLPRELPIPRLPPITDLPGLPDGTSALLDYLLGA
jgi:virulence factor Mce-like protein